MMLIRHDSGHDATGHEQDSPDAVDVLTAATALGITPDAVRKRLSRGQLAGMKRDGRWLVVLSLPNVPIIARDRTRTGHDRPPVNSDRTADGTATGPDTPADTPAALAVYQELVEQFRGEVSFLREELRRKDALIAALVQRPAELARPVSDTTRTGPDTTSQAHRTGRLPWWRRLLAALTDGP